MHDIPSFYEAFEQGDIPELSDTNMHHMLNVLRMKSGEECFLCNGKGIQYHIQLTSVGKRKVEYQIKDTQQFSYNTEGFILAIAFTKNPARMEWLIEKACEIGVKAIVPLITERSERLHFKADRFRKILISAMLQSRRYFLPEMYEPQSLQTVISWPIPIKTLAHCMDMGIKKQLSQLVQANQELIVCIGPEGDFTEAEVLACEHAGFQSITLGQQRLRTETAGLFSLAQYHTALQMQTL